MGTYPSSTCRQSIAAWPLMTLTDFQAKSGGTGMHKDAVCICPSFPAASPAARHGHCTAVSLFFFFLGKKFFIFRSNQTGLFNELGPCCLPGAVTPQCHGKGWLQQCGAAASFGPCMVPALYLLVQVTKLGSL